MQCDNEMIEIRVKLQNLCLQTTNMFIVNQSVLDITAAILIFLTGIFNVSGQKMSASSSYDQFVCRVWLSRYPLWGVLDSTFT